MRAYASFNEYYQVLVLLTVFIIVFSNDEALVSFHAT
jgi:hypothetical protein